MADFHHPKLRLLKGDELTHQELDNNINSFYYSSSLDGSNIKLYAGSTSGSFNGYTQSYDVNAFTASHAISASYISTASYALFAISSSVEVTLEHSSSYAESASFADISNNAATASHFANGVISASVNLNTLTLRKADNSTLSYLIHTGSGEANPDGLLSSSAQIATDISGSLSNLAISALNAGIVSASAQIRDRLVSAGAFTSASNASIRNTLGTNQFILSGSKPNANTLRLHPAAGTNLDYEVGGEDTRLQAVLDITGSILTATSSYALKTDISGSGNVRFEALNSITGSLIKNAALSGSTTNTIRFTKQDDSTIDLTIVTSSVSINGLLSSSAQIAEDISGSGNVRFEAINSVTSSYYNSSSIAGDTIKLFTGTATHSIVIDDANQRDYISNIEIANGHDITFTGVGSAFDGTIAVTLVDSASHSEFADLAHVANSATSASHSEFADLAHVANSATTATSASHSEFADLAHVANSATSASHSEFADLAHVANSATTATTASHALYSVSASAALYSTSASHAINATKYVQTAAIDGTHGHKIDFSRGDGTSFELEIETGSSTDTRDYISGVSYTSTNGRITFVGQGSAFNSHIDLPVGTNDSLTVASITATSASFDRLDTQIISSSVIYNSGSNIFGDSVNDKHMFTGSVTITGSLTVDGTSLFTNGIVSSSAQIDHDSTTNFVAGEHFLQSAITTVGTVTAGNVTAILPNGIPSGSASQARSQIGAGTGDGTVDTSGSPVDNDYAKFTDANTVEGRSFAQVRSDLNVEDGADVTDATNVKSNLPDGVPSGSASQARSQIGAGTGTVDTSGTPVAQQVALFTDANTISGSTNLKMHVNGSYPQFNGLQVGDGGTANLYLGNAIEPNSANKGARFHSNDADFYFDFQGDSTQNFFLRDYDGSGGIFTRFTFDFINSDFATDTGTFSGNVTANNFVTTSDRKLKKDLEPIKEGLETLKKFVSYEYELENKKDAGFIAQEVQESLPYAVHTKKDGYLALDTKPIIAHMHKAILEIDQRLSAIEEKLK